MYVNHLSHLCVGGSNVSLFFVFCFLDVGDLQNFVNVALATAAGGEGALACDKLSNLVKVGSGFGSLIYTLQQDASFIALADSCRSVWEAIKHTPSLPRLLVGY